MYEWVFLLHSRHDVGSLKKGERPFEWIPFDDFCEKGSLYGYKSGSLGGNELGGRGVHTIFVLNQSPICAVCGETKNLTSWGPLAVLAVFHTYRFLFILSASKERALMSRSDCPVWKTRSCNG